MHCGWIAASVAIGLPYAIAVVGWSSIDPTNLAWLRGDPAETYIGWAFYRYEPAWHFPLTWSTRLGYPLGISISYLDPIPLVAVLLRPLSGILPASFQYLGLWGCLCLVLQAYFALRLSSLLFRGAPLAVFAATLLLLGAPAATARLAAHHVLASHWLILASLWAYFRDLPVASAWRWFMPFAAVLALAGGISPYLSMLCLLIAFAGIARLLLARRCRWLEAAGLSVLLCGCLALSLVVFGFIVPGGSSGYEGGGYGFFSMNLLAPVDPMQWGSSAVPALPTATPGQAEGYNYLGLGVIGLWVINVLWRPRAVPALVTRKTAPLLVVAVLCTVAALSATITVGSVTLARFALPRSIEFVAHSFRASGRLFWPVHYLLILAAVVLSFRRWSSPWRELLLIGAVVVQAADLAPMRSRVRATLAASVESPLHSVRWRTLGEEHKRLIVLPAWQCGFESSPGGLQGFATFGLLAAALRLETNSYYAARATREQFQTHCVDVPAATVDGGLDPEAAYVVDDKTLVAWGLSGVSTHRCDVVDGFNLCTRDSNGGGPGPAWRDKIRGMVSSYALGSRLEFGGVPNGTPFLWLGWSLPEPWGTWSAGRDASLLLRPEITEPTDLDLIATVQPYVNDRHRRLGVVVKANGQPVARWNFTDGAEPGEQRARIPAQVMVGNTYLYIRFIISEAASPASLGLSADERVLGIGLETLRLVRAGDGEAQPRFETNGPQPAP